MRTRSEITKNILDLQGDLESLRIELSRYPWDLEQPLIEITAEDILKAMRKAVNEEITPAQLEKWANLMECRDDFDFKNEELQEIIFLLANPILHGSLEKEHLIKISNRLLNLI